MSFMENNNGSVGDLLGAGGGLGGVAKNLLGGIYGGMQARDDRNLGFYMPQFSWRGNGLADQKFNYIPYPRKQTKWGSNGDSMMSMMKNLNKPTSTSDFSTLGTIGKYALNNVLGGSDGYDSNLGVIGSNIFNSLGSNKYNTINDNMSSGIFSNKYNNNSSSGIDFGNILNTIGSFINNKNSSSGLGTIGNSVSSYLGGS